MTYTPGIPTSGQKINQTTTPIATNFTQANTIFGTDHVEFNNATVADRGKHKAGRFIEQGADPATAANEMAIYTKAVAAVTQLFFRDESSGTIRQVTGLTASGSGAGNHTLLLPMGIRINFGSVTVGPAPGTGVTFNTAFSTLYFVVANQQGGNAEAISIQNPLTTGFTGVSSSSTLPIFYFALGAE